MIKIIKLNSKKEKTVNDRLKELIAELKFATFNEFDRAIDVKINTTSRYIRRRESNIKGYYIEKLFLKFNNINADWFLTGEGNQILYKDKLQTIEEKYKAKEQKAIKYENSFGIH